MAKGGPIIIVEDDPDDREIYASIIASLDIENDLIFFNNGKPALDYFYTTGDKPMAILCDINMPEMNGLELRRKINADDYLRKKSIPFIFITTTASKKNVDEAYELTVQGFFIKPPVFNDFARDIKLIIAYWLSCKHPNSYP